MERSIEVAGQFVALHRRPGLFMMPNPWDVGSARILAGLGYPALATTSAGLAWSLGRRDGAVSRDEALRHAAAIVAATDLPVSADLENGFGDAPEEAAATIREAAGSGLAGASIEDHTGRGDRPLYDPALAVERIAAAVEAARGAGRPFVLTARAEGLLHGETRLGPIIARLRAFADAGADIVYAPGLRDIASIAEVCAAVAPCPVNALIGIGGGRFTLAELERAGVRRVSFGGVLAKLAYGALIEAAQEPLASGSFAFVDGAPASSALERFMAPLGN